MAATGEFSWPPAGSFHVRLRGISQWPLTLVRQQNQGYQSLEAQPGWRNIDTIVLTANHHFGHRSFNRARVWICFLPRHKLE